ncbi:MAG: methyltransferase domain-containing protein [Bacteroidetes bacterium]|nr:methyltransferase domain-containing protein [Bacteroidota bacterium]MCB0841651.1 methyltransferase domain-containing protein [Bacteroidota bacterium]
MNQEGFEFLIKPEVRALIEANLDTNPRDFALNHKNNGNLSPLVPSQIKNLQKSKKKIPSFYHARCIIPNQAYEQCSSEKAAQMRHFSGKNCLDLTCGLGVDTFIYTQNFESVTSLERNPVYCEIAKYNFQQLGVTNVKIINTSAEDYLDQYSGPPFDLIYADPSRRDTDGNRLKDINTFSPNIISLLPRLTSLSSRILFKLSPLFDLNEAYNIFPEATSVSIISIDNECKELWVEINQMEKSSSSGRSIPLNVLLNKQDKLYSFVFPETVSFPIEKALEFSEYQYIIEPDTAFYKGRINRHLFHKYFPHLNGYLNHDTGFFFCKELPDQLDFPGRVFKIITSFPYKPKVIPKKLKALKINRLNITKRFFPFSVKEIRKALNVEDGGEMTLLCTQWESKKQVFLAESV